MNRVTVQDAASMSPAFSDRNPFGRRGVRKAKVRCTAEALNGFGFGHDQTAASFARRPSETSIYTVSASETAFLSGSRTAFGVDGPHTAKERANTNRVPVPTRHLRADVNASEQLGEHISDGLVSEPGRTRRHRKRIRIEVLCAKACLGRRNHMEFRGSAR